MTTDSYTATVVSAIQGLETGLADIMSTSSAQATSIYQVLDNSADKGLNVAYDMLGKVAKREFYELGHMFWDALNALMMAIAVFLIHLPATATIIMAKLGLGMMLGLGPLFIAALMFPVTAKWFDKWFEQALAYILEIAITMVVVSVGVALFKALFDRVISTTTDNPISSFVQIIVLALIIFFAQRKTSGLGATSCRTWARTGDRQRAAPSTVSDVHVASASASPSARPFHLWPHISPRYAWATPSVASRVRSCRTGRGGRPSGFALFLPPADRLHGFQRHQG